MSMPTSSLPRLILFEDDHLLVVNKPAGLNTHSPAPFAGEGIYEWLRDREPRWASLAIIHRLDKETSGVLLFTKTPMANRSLTGQFTRREVSKEYRLLTNRTVPFRELTVESALVRTGDLYQARPLTPGADAAITHFRVVDHASSFTQLVAEPVTGRTHQIRAHAAAHGFPILGDALYGGSVEAAGAAPRVCLHAEKLSVRHPGTGDPLTFCVPVNFDLNHRLWLRESLIDVEQTNAWRAVHGAADGWPDRYVDRLGEMLLVQSDTDVFGPGQTSLEPHPGRDFVEPLRAHYGSKSIYHRTLGRAGRSARVEEASPQKWSGEPAPERFPIRENGVAFTLSFQEGASVGLFLDQRDNRRRFLVNHVAAGFPLWEGGATGRTILNAFAYTCGFSVCAALAGARTTSLDLSRKYLDWGRGNFGLNGLDPGAHEFIQGDAFDWLRRLAKKGRRFDAIVLDPPTFSRSKEAGAFRAEKDFGRLLAAALPVLGPGGVLLASSNATTLEPDHFLQMIDEAAVGARRRVVQRHYVPQPPDFPITRAEPAHLKTVWLRFE